MPISARLTRGDLEGPYADYRRFAQQRMERAALTATSVGTRVAVRSIRGEMAGAGLGRLGNGLGTSSDLERGRGVKRYTNGGFSASGVVFIRSGSERTRGAIEAYTGGADIRPVRGRWLWIATDQIPRVTGKYRMTPELYRANGFEQKIGPLVFVRGINGYPLLVVKDASVSAAGKARSARSRTKRGALRKGQAAKAFIVAFIGIPRTARAARVNVNAIMQRVAGQLPTMFNEALGRV